MANLNNQASEITFVLKTPVHQHPPSLTWRVIHVLQGTLLVRERECLTLATPGFAAVISAGVAFQSQLSVGAIICSVELDAASGQFELAHCHVVWLSPLAVELMKALASTPQTSHLKKRAQLLGSLLIDEVQKLLMVPLNILQ